MQVQERLHCSKTQYATGCDGRALRKRLSVLQFQRKIRATLPQPSTGLFQSSCRAPFKPRTVKLATASRQPVEVSASTTTADVETKPDHKIEKDQFSWTKQWYPVGPLEYLDSSKPQGFTVMGYNVVVWKDGQGEWRVFDDQCPHRAAPLSEGRVVPSTGTLQCSYHGWQFDGEGHCVGIPQAPDEKAGLTAQASKRSCAKSFPTSIKYGVLWMWMEKGPEAFIEAAANPVFTVTEMESEGGKFFPLAKWYMREVPVSFESLLENNGDPSHVFFTHHGVLAKRDASEPIVLRPATSSTQPDSDDCYVFDVQGPGFPIVKLAPPAILWAGDPEGKAGGGIGLLLAVTPIRPGFSRIMTLALMANPKLRWLAKVLNWQPWLRHVWNHDVHDGDITVLHRQERYVERHGAKGWRKEYFLPNKSDAGVISLRSWLEKAGPVQWGPDVSNPSMPPEETRREVLLDRYHQHTKQCPSCSKALDTIQKLQVVLTTVAAAAFLGLTYLFGQGVAVRSSPVLASSFALLAAALAVVKLKSMERKFIYTDYVHADHA